MGGKNGSGALSASAERLQSRRGRLTVKTGGPSDVFAVFCNLRFGFVESFGFSAYLLSVVFMCLSYKNSVSLKDKANCIGLVDEGNILL